MSNFLLDLMMLMGRHGVKVVSAAPISDTTVARVLEGKKRGVCQHTVFGSYVPYYINAEQIWGGI